jgi:hypothetical protein
MTKQWVCRVALMLQAGKLHGQRHSPIVDKCRLLLVHQAGHIYAARDQAGTTTGWEPGIS